MSIEVEQLRNKPEPFEWCPKCILPFRSLMRGEVQSAWRRVFHMPYCCVICDACKQIVGYEKP